jgi:putative membrane protein
VIPRIDLTNLARGFLMGGADVIPGVSGGTVALILGIYERLVTSISRFDLTLFDHVRSRKWREAEEHVNLRFLLTLGSGIALGIAGFATIMHYLLHHHTQHTLAAFFGLILASSLLVARMVQHWNVGTALLFPGGVVFAYWLVGQSFLEKPPAGNAYVFLCGMIGICAMILPGISGAFILLVLGKYEDITGVLKDTLHGDISLANLATITIFCTGCLVGLLSFSKFLRWLLARHESQTMAVLCGFMLGSLRRIWPFRLDLTPAIEKFSQKEWEYLQHDLTDGSVIASSLIAVAAFAFVVLLDRWTQGHEHIPPLAETETSE